MLSIPVYWNKSRNYKRGYNQKFYLKYIIPSGSLSVSVKSSQLICDSPPCNMRLVKGIWSLASCAPLTISIVFARMIRTAIKSDSTAAERVAKGTTSNVVINISTGHVTRINKQLHGSSGN